MKQLFKTWAALWLFCCAAPSYAFTCYFTLAKDSCWTNFNVTVTVIDAINGNPVTTVTVPKGKPWNRQQFTCEPGSKYMYSATFTPTFWSNDEGKSYDAQQYWTLPTEVTSGTSAWDIPVCFPKAFSEVPLPPTANNSCQCDMKSISPIPPAKK